MDMNFPLWVAIPVVALLIPIAAIIADAVKKIKQRELIHQERLKAIEMGLGSSLKDLNLEPEETKVEKRNGKSPGLHGAIWAGVGGGLLLSSGGVFYLATNSEWKGFASFLLLWAMPALGVGIALLIYSAKNKKNGESGGA
jgi:hypothetical protein